MLWWTEDKGKNRRRERNETNAESRTAGVTLNAAVYSLRLWQNPLNGEVAKTRRCFWSKSRISTVSYTNWLFNKRLNSLRNINFEFNSEMESPHRYKKIFGKDENLTRCMWRGLHVKRTLQLCGIYIYILAVGGRKKLQINTCLIGKVHRQTWHKLKLIKRRSLNYNYWKRKNDRMKIKHAKHSVTQEFYFQ